MSDCIFCKIVNQEAPAFIVWEDENHMAFLSIYPNTEGFTVVISKKHLPSYAFDNTDKDLTELVIASKKVAKILDASFVDVGRTGMIFEGFGVDHLHSKLYPMHGTGNMKEWQPIDSDVKDMVFETYPGFISSNNGPRKSDEELQKTLNKIKKQK